MAIVSVTEKCEEWSGVETEKGDLEFTRVFMVLADTRNVGPNEVRNAQDPNTGLQVPPRFTDYHAGDDTVTYAWVKSKDIKRDPLQPRLWYVTVKYSSSRETQDSASQENPLLRPYVVRWGSNKYQKPIDRDIDDTLIQNTAGEFYDPLPEIDDSRPVLSITRNEADPWNFTAAIQYQDAINSDSFYGFDPYQAKIHSITAGKRAENQFTYWEVTYEIEFRREGWRLKTISRGRNERSVDGNSLVPILDSTTRQPISEPQMLDEDGYVLYSAGGAVEQTFYVYKELAFGPLGLE